MTKIMFDTSTLNFEYTSDTHTPEQLVQEYNNIYKDSSAQYKDGNIFIKFNSYIDDAVITDRAKWINNHVHQKAGTANTWGAHWSAHDGSY